MKVKLISWSQGPLGADDSLENIIAYCARVSNPGNQKSKNIVTKRKLLEYLIEHKHWSPFEIVSICLEIETTRDIARQILRHRSFSFQEFSQRYADPTQELDFEYRHVRLQDLDNRQNSIDNQDMDLEAEWVWRQQNIINEVQFTYDWAKDRGIAKEQIRAVLPEGLTKTRMYMNGTLRSWIHYIEQRTGKETQLEHREVAEACKKEIFKVFPLIEKLT